ncbi:unnamed protein product [Rhizoctonia solani]|uniref:F-box domain-containing protein n=1 Tax=Rhizoctonia solani TaxID=456999 RepID=A0A8H2XM78_9AGAM|nr:unnamed protein product [Rhizoctonia solani]
MNSITAFKLEDLSPELIANILHFCDCSTILRFAATCKVYRELVAQSTSLQLHIELEFNGLELLTGSSKRDTTYSEILKDIRHFRDACLKTYVSEPIVRPAPRALESKLQDGYLITAFSQSGEVYPDALQFIPLHTETPDPPPLLFDFTFSEFTADPEQGLVAMLFRDPGRDELCHIRLCSTTTGLAHPLAQHPRLTAEFGFALRPLLSGLAIEIMEHQIVARISLIRSDIYEVLIWDWTSGILVHRISSREGICDVAFLDRRHLAVLSVTRSSSAPESLELLIYATSNDASTLEALPNRKIRVEDYSISQPLLRLAFPQLRESSDLKINESSLLLKSGPTPSRKIYTNSAVFSCPYTLTLSMTFCFRNVVAGWHLSHPYRVFIDGRFLQEQAHIRLNDRTSTQVVPWCSWGTNATRWFTSPGELGRLTHWPFRITGSRYIQPFLNSPYHCIFDFSSLTLGRFRESPEQSYPTEPQVDDSEAGDGFWNLQQLDSYLLELVAHSPPNPGPFVLTVGADNPSTINDSPFDEPITTRLPYRIVYKRKPEQDYDRWQIDRDCVVGFASSGPLSETIAVYKPNQ